MFKNQNFILLLALLIIQNLTVECFNTNRVKRTVKDIPANCKTVTHSGKCIGRDNGDSPILSDRFNSKLINPKPYKVRFIKEKYYEISLLIIFLLLLRLKRPKIQIKYPGIKNCGK